MPLPRSHCQLERQHSPALATLGQALQDCERRHPLLDLLGHSHRVQAVTAQLCLALGMAPERADAIAAAAFFHDVGKLALPFEILAKTGPLEVNEQALVARHCEIGADLLSKETGAFARVAADVALWHHQRFDGGGYPGGLAGQDIPIEARIVAVADVYDALRSERAYKPALGHNDVVKTMVEGDHRLPPGAFDPDLLQALCDHQLDISITWDCAALAHLAWRMEGPPCRRSQALQAAL